MTVGLPVASPSRCFQGRKGEKAEGFRCMVSLMVVFCKRAQHLVNLEVQISWQLQHLSSGRSCFQTWGGMFGKISQLCGPQLGRYETLYRIVTSIQIRVFITCRSFIFLMLGSAGVHEPVVANTESPSPAPWNPLTCPARTTSARERALGVRSVADPSGLRGLEGQRTQ